MKSEIPVYKWKMEKNPPGKPGVYSYFINLDERGEFFADVRNTNGKTVFEIHGFEIFEDGFMKHKRDLRGLEEYLKSLGIMPQKSRLVGGNINPLTPAEKKNVMAEARVHQKLPGLYYRGMADGMKDIAKEYGRVASSSPGIRAAQLKSHLAMLNPPMKKIYNRVLQVFASKAGMPHHCDAKCRAAGHRYQHKFSSKACVYGLPDGSILIK